MRVAPVAGGIAGFGDHIQSFSCCVAGYGKRRRNASEEVPMSQEERLVSLISKLGGQVRRAAAAGNLASCSCLHCDVCVTCQYNDVTMTLHCWYCMSLIWGRDKSHHVSFVMISVICQI